MEDCTLIADSALDTEKIGVSLAASLYVRPLLITLHGEIGSGKTTFTQGFARGLGITEPVTSPTYAIENRYGATLSHIDLHRLAPAKTRDVLRAAEEFPGITIIEWGEIGEEFLPSHHRISVTFSDVDRAARKITIHFEDGAIPSDAEIDAWHAACGTPSHIREHERIVCDVAMQSADALLARGIVVRKKALQRAALLHDVLRMVDFTDATADTWREQREAYGRGHETAAQKLMEQCGYPIIGRIIRTHGAPKNESSIPRTTEQKLLSYADKRVMHTQIVSVAERFADFVTRYGGGQESPAARAWKLSVQALERELFPEGPPL